MSMGFLNSFTHVKCIHNNLTSKDTGEASPWSCKREMGWGEWRINGGMDEGEDGVTSRVPEREICTWWTCCITWTPGGLALWITTICVWPSGWKSPFPRSSGWWGLGGSGGLASGPAEPYGSQLFGAPKPPAPEENFRTQKHFPHLRYTHTHTHTLRTLLLPDVDLCVYVCVSECLSRKGRKREREMCGVQAVHMTVTGVCAYHLTSRRVGNTCRCLF